MEADQHRVTAEIATRVVGRIDGSLNTAEGAIDTPLQRLVADAALTSTRDPARGGAEIAFINSGGVRTTFRPAADGSVTYGQIFALQPFGNTVEVIELTGAQIKAVIEQQFARDGTGNFRQSFLIPSQGFAYTIDRSAPDGANQREKSVGWVAILRSVPTSDCVSAVKSGFSYGTTDEFAYNVIEHPVHVHDFHATLLHLLGIDHERLTYFHQGRRFRLTDVHGQVVRALLA